ncbi:MAG TPA: Maf family nucleotide pyrophosphatase [Brumimicrobium sp.]|nr:Maf family nucleotide pyrophosphatase [Brumimicrobium sp.]
MHSKKIILGSASPRRKQLMEQLGLTVEIRKKEVSEIYPSSLHHHDVPEFLSRLKAEPLKESIKENEVLLTSDTVVIHKGKILGKPEDREDAIEMLQALSDGVHEVVSAVYVYTLGFEKSFSVTTKVYFRALLQKVIEHYVDAYQPFDKAGAYGIQEWIGMIGVEKIEGCFYNVMGLPVNKVWEILSLMNREK